MKWGKEHYYNMIVRINDAELKDKPISEKHAIKWVHETILGGITKEKLDK